jgi:His-Xaa-Ser system radical SAM maturase HxsC
VLPLHAKAHHSWEKPALLKVAGLREFASGLYPLDRMILDLRDPAVKAASGVLPHLGWAGFLTDEAGTEPTNSLLLLGDAAIVQPGDVIEILPSLSKVHVRYRRGDNGNVLFATERCNSHCLMCSQPPRLVEDGWRVDQLCSLAELIDKDECSIAISGGEPTLLGAGLLRIVRHCARVLPNTHIHVLTNGRRFSESGYAQTFRDAHPSLTWGVPLYGDHYRLHDYVVQSVGAFAETMRGLFALHDAGQRIELRIVLVKPTVERLAEIARYIYRNLSFVSHIALMGVEPIGFAKANYETLWVDPADMADVISETVGFLSRRDMNVSIYNLPLCCLPRPLWPYARRSISNWKQTYLPACDACSLREQCAGVFAWTNSDWTSRAIQPIKCEEMTCATH